MTATTVEDREAFPCIYQLVDLAVTLIRAPLPVCRWFVRRTLFRVAPGYRLRITPLNDCLPPLSSCLSCFSVVVGGAGPVGAASGLLAPSVEGASTSHVNDTARMKACLDTPGQGPCPGSASRPSSRCLRTEDASALLTNVAGYFVTTFASSTISAYK